MLETRVPLPVCMTKADQTNLVPQPELGSSVSTEKQRSKSNNTHDRKAIGKEAARQPTRQRIDLIKPVHSC